MAAYEGWGLDIAWWSDPDATTPDWIAEAGRVDGTVTITRGRTAETSDIQAGRMVWSMTDPDRRYSPGNPASPLYGRVTLAVPVRCWEDVGSVRYIRFRGWISSIDAGEAVDDVGDHTVLLVALDRLDRLASATTIPSTLAGHIIGSAAPGTLVGYWPVESSGGRIAYAAGPVDQPPLLRQFATNTLSGSPLGADSPELLAIGSGDPVLADDQPSARFAPVATPAAPVPAASAQLVTDSLTGVTLSGSQVLTLAAWCKPTALPQWDGVLASIAGTGFVAQAELWGTLSTPGPGAWTPHTVSGGWSAWSAGPAPAVDRWQLVALRVRLSPALVELWVADSVYTAPLTGSAPASATLTQVMVGAAGMSGDIAHVQVYLSGPGGDYTAAQHIAQIAAATTAFARQTTGERIAMLAGWAGIPPERLAIDPGATVMGPARLGGGSPLDGMSTAATTEAGDLYAAGDDRLVMRDRRRRYNQPVDAVVQRDWLGGGPNPRVEGPVVTVAEVTQAGATARAVDPVARRRYGERPGPVRQIDSAVETEARSAAVYLVRAYGQPRTRVASLPLDLLPWVGDAAVMHTVLGLDIGVRIALAGMPASYDPGAAALVVEGYTERIGTDVRQIDLVTSPVLGPAPGATYPVAQLNNAVLGQLNGANTLLGY